MNNTSSEDGGAVSVIIFVIAIIFLIFHFSDRILSIWQHAIVPVAYCWGWLAETPIGQQLMPLLHRDPQVVARIPAYLASLGPEQLKALSYSGAKQYGDYVHRFTSLIVGPALIIIGFRCYRHNRMSDPRMFKVIMGIPAITDVLKSMPGREWMRDVVDASKLPLFSGKIALQAPITPWRMAELYGLYKMDESNKLTAFDRDKACAIYQNTVGRPFTSIEALAKGPYARLWAELMSQLPKEDRESAAKAATKGHLYEKTVIIGLIRMMGQIMIVNYGPLTFMRYRDIAFYDALCSCGRRVSLAAGAGIMGQFRHEVEVYRASKGSIAPTLTAGSEWAADWLEEALRTDPFERPWVETDDIWADFDPWL
ncbi:hypothetical protein ACI2KR_30675 [Pseudomonas luteola]